LTGTEKELSFTHVVEYAMEKILHFEEKYESIEVILFGKNPNQI